MFSTSWKPTLRNNKCVEAQHDDHIDEEENDPTDAFSPSLTPASTQIPNQNQPHHQMEVNVWGSGPPTYPSSTDSGHKSVNNGPCNRRRPPYNW